MEDNIFIKKIVKITCIQWDTDGFNTDLPTEIEVEMEYWGYEDLSEKISNWLSDEYGYCHFGFKFEVEE